jgi:hypothetical protein
VTKSDNPESVSHSAKRNSDVLAGPLTVSQSNPRYFTAASDAEQKAVYLTGSHIWNNFHDGMGPGSDCAETPEPFDYDAYLKFLKEHGHNFIRLWRWEQFKCQAAGSSYHLCMAPQPWSRTGPGTAKDGKPKFDLDSFAPAYFNRLRDRVIAAGHEGIYVAVMLFDGFGLHLSPAPDNVDGHPFHSANNINGVSIDSILDYQVLPLDPRVRALQEAYIHKVVDTVHDLPHVLWEVANESSGGGSSEGIAGFLGMEGSPDWGDSTEWQYWVIDVVKRYESQQGYDKHPIGMTMQFPVAEQTKVNKPLLRSQAEWISPGYDDAIFTGGRHPNKPGAPQSHWLEDPPANKGVKVVITDTDHYAPGRGDALWAWKSFLRGHHPILMDFGILGGVNPRDPSAGSPRIPPYHAFEPARYAMGDTLRFAQKMNLLEMEPCGELSSTRYVLANRGEEYLILQPRESAEPFNVTLEAGTYTVEWFSVNDRRTKQAGKVTVDTGSTNFTAPFAKAGPAVLYLKHVDP